MRRLDGLLFSGLMATVIFLQSGQLAGANEPAGNESDPWASAVSSSSQQGNFDAMSAGFNAFEKRAIKTRAGTLLQRGNQINEREICRSGDDSAFGRQLLALDRRSNLDTLRDYKQHGKTGLATARHADC